MQMIYNSDNYYIVEFGVGDQHAILSAGGYEIVGENLRRKIFLGDELARRFHEDVKRLIASEPTTEEVDDFLGKFDTVVTQPVIMR